MSYSRFQRMNPFSFRMVVVFLMLVLVCPVFGQSAKKLGKEGLKQLKAGKYELAEKAFSQSLALKPAVYKVLMGRAQTYEYSRQYEKSIADYQEALKQDIRNHKLYLKIADLDILIKKYQDGLSILQKLIVFDELNRDALERMTWCHILLKEFTEAAKICDFIISGDAHHTIRQDHIINYYHGIVQDSLKNFQGSVLSYVKAISLLPPPPPGKHISPAFKPYYVNLATAQYHLNQQEESLKNYSIASVLDVADTVDPKNYTLYNLRSYVYELKSDYTNAFGDLDRSIVMNPKDYHLFMHRAALNQKTSNFHSAISDYTKAILLDPENAPAYTGRGTCYLDLADFQNAITDFHKSLLLDENDAQAKELLEAAEKKNFDANRESDAPELRIDYPVADLNSFINIYETQLDVIVSGQAKDKSGIKFIKVNGINAQITTEEKTHYFKCKVPITAEFRKIEVTAQDIYSNQSTVTMKVGRLVDDSKVAVTFKGKLLADDEHKTPLENKIIYLCNEKGEALYSTRTDASGFFKFVKLPFDKNYILSLDVSDSPLAAVQKFIVTNEQDKVILRAKANGKATYKFEVLQTDDHVLTLMSMDDEPLKIDLKGKLLADNDNRSPLANVNVQLVNEKAELISTQKTDMYGVFNFGGLMPDVSYSVKISEEDAKSIPFDKIILTDSRGKIIKEIAKGVYGYFTYELLGLERGMLSSISEPDPWLKAIKLSKENTELEIIDNLYYESGAFQIMPTFEPELNKAVDAMKNNPKIVVEIQSHTDALAGDDYNMELSQKRASAVAEYMISKGIDKKRIIAKGYGETRLINRCANGVDCSDAEHKQNRRTVFKLNYATK